MTKNKLDKLKKKEKESLRKIRETNQALVARDIAEKQVKVRYSQDLFNKGNEWFDAGLSLDEAPLEMKNHDSFIGGYNHGKRIKLVNDILYDLGVDYFNREIPLSQVPDNYRNNSFFLEGYNSKNIHNVRK